MFSELVVVAVEGKMRSFVVLVRLAMDEVGFAEVEAMCRLLKVEKLLLLLDKSPLEQADTVRNQSSI